MKLFAVTSFLALLGTTSVHALEPLPGLRYEAPENCPEGEALVHRIASRLSQSSVSLLPSMLPISIRLEGNPHGVVGHLLIGSDHPRSFIGNTCAEVTEAIAIVVASQIAREQEALAERPTTEESPGASPRRSDVGTETGSPRPKNGEQSPVTAVRTGKAPSAAPAGPVTLVRWPAPRLLVPRRRPSLRILTGGMIILGSAPAPAWGPRIGVELELDASFSPLFTLSVERTATGTLDTPPAQASFEWTTLRGLGCLQSTGLSGVRLRSCAELAYGVFHAEGMAQGPITDPHSASGPWLSLGPALGIAFPWSPRLELDLQAALPIPLFREKAVFRDPNSAIHTTSSITAAFGVSIKAYLSRSKPKARGIAPL